MGMSNAERQRKYRERKKLKEQLRLNDLARKRENAKAHGVTILENGFVAVRGKEFTYYAWDDHSGSYQGILSGTLDKPLT
jgi:hypothetical protein